MSSKSARGNSFDQRIIKDYLVKVTQIEFVIAHWGKILMRVFFHVFKPVILIVPFLTILCVS